MARQVDDLYRGHRFIVSSGGEVFSASRIFNDLFDPSIIWIGAAHKVGVQTLDERFNVSKTASFWMFSLQENMFRRIDVSWSHVEWLPFDLDASDGGLAMDWVKLRNAQVSLGPRDVPLSDAPPYIQEVFSPRHHGASR